MKTVNRWFYAGLGVILLMFAGILYAWSVLSAPIAEEFAAWTTAQLSFVFTLTMICFCLGGLVGGLLGKRVSPRICSWISAALFLAGWLITGRIQALWQICLSFGVLCGFGSGILYNAVMSTVGKWFTDRQGLISGILLMGFGISSFLAGKIYRATLVSWRTSFTVIGILSAAVTGLGGWFLRRPREGEIAFSGQKNPVGQQTPNARPRESFTPREAMATARFWLFYGWAILLSAAGLAVVSQANGILTELGANITAGTAATLIGLISVFNGVGRILSGASYDRFGRRVTMFSVSVSFILAAIALFAGLKLRSLLLVTVGFILGGLSYGAVPPNNSAFAGATFGMEHYPIIYSLINTNLVIASFGSTVAGALYDASGSYVSACGMIVLCAILGAVASRGITACERKRENP